MPFSIMSKCQLLLAFYLLITVVASDALPNIFGRRAKEFYNGKRQDKCNNDNVSRCFRAASDRDAFCRSFLGIQPVTTTVATVTPVT